MLHPASNTSPEARPRILRSVHEGPSTIVEIGRLTPKKTFDDEP